MVGCGYGKKKDVAIYPLINFSFAHTASLKWTRKKSEGCWKKVQSMHGTGGYVWTSM